MSELAKSITQIRAATSQLKQEVDRLDQRLAVLHEKRREMLEKPVTKHDFVEMVRADIRNRALYFENYIRKSIAGSVKTYSHMRRVLEKPGTHVIHSYLTEPGVPVDVTDKAFFMFLEDALVERMARIMESMDWPEDAAPAAGREEAIAAIDSEIEATAAERSALVGQMNELGLTL